MGRRDGMGERRPEIRVGLARPAAIDKIGRVESGSRSRSNGTFRAQ
jgi:hypothetical protein